MDDRISREEDSLAAGRSIADEFERLGSASGSETSNPKSGPLSEEEAQAVRATLTLFGANEATIMVMTNPSVDSREGFKALVATLSREDRDNLHKVLHHIMARALAAGSIIVLMLTGARHEVVVEVDTERGEQYEHDETDEERGW